MKFDLSIIVPIYNVEKFLVKCLTSIIDNSWGNIIYEIIIVNDGSPDRSADIAVEFANIYKNIVVITQENKGLGGARNTGIANAKGTYLFFLDSDDFLKTNKIQGVLKNAIKNDLDILEFGAERVDTNYEFLDRIFRKEHSEVLIGLDYIKKYDFENSVCNKIYRKEFLIDNQIKFFERTYVEDAPFNAESLTKAKRVQSIKDVPVVFYQNAESITRQRRTGDNLRKFIEDSIRVTSKINFIAYSDETRQARSVLQKRVSVFTSGIILMILKSKFSLAEKRRYFSELRTAELYPVKNKSEIFVRDVFIMITNNKLLLNVLLKLL